MYRILSYICNNKVFIIIIIIAPQQQNSLVISVIGLQKAEIMG